MENKRKILMVCEAFGGGVFAYVSQLCNDMCNHFDVFLAYALRPQTPKDFTTILDKRIHLIEVKNFGGSIFNVKKDIQVINELQKIANSINPELIHLHSSVAGGIGRIAFARSQVPVVYTPHGYAHILMGKGGMKLEMYKWMEYILGKTNCITLTCCKSEDEVAKTLTKRTAYIETGVNLEELSAQLDSIHPIKDKKFTVYTLGRTCVQKQPELFNEIAQLVPEARFVWIGGGELDHLLTAPNLELTGWKPRHEALAMGKGADVFILCSLGEAIAMSLIENMYMGKLILVSNVMGNKSVIQNGKNGYVCDTAKDYADRIKEAIKNYPKEICEQAIKDVRTIYNTHVMTNKYVKFYNNAIAGQYK
ncbi:glycosyltransferase [Phocaeicola plebeius]|jgi:glycosyltransferase involved in cell wall biosynthesis|uniref:glycosyltransferase n=1 Tax=Phocaeicola plebeius TaxID=310297 RepID=UPI00241D9A94|nr:glycosyltransferase [Phocaeicola plebeius]